MKPVHFPAWLAGKPFQFRLGQTDAFAEFGFESLLLVLGAPDIRNAFELNGSKWSRPLTTSLPSRILAFAALPKAASCRECTRSLEPTKMNAPPITSKAMMDSIFLLIALMVITGHWYVGMPLKTRRYQRH